MNSGLNSFNVTSYFRTRQNDGMMGQFLVNGIPMGLNAVGAEQDIRIYPNPVADHLTIEDSGVDQIPLSLEIRNSLEQLFFHQKISGFPSTLNTGDLKAGIYYVSIIYQDRIVVKKVKCF